MEKFWEERTLNNSERQSEKPSAGQNKRRRSELEAPWLQMWPCCCHGDTHDPEVTPGRGFLQSEPQNKELRVDFNTSNAKDWQQGSPFDSIHLRVKQLNAPRLSLNFTLNIQVQAQCISETTFSDLVKFYKLHNATSGQPLSDRVWKALKSSKEGRLTHTGT